MQAVGPHEVLARDRRRYERLLLSRMGGKITKEDAEDIVSESLIRVQIKADEEPPRSGREGPWFARIVINLGIDFLRARDGRRHNRPSVVPLTEIDEGTRALVDRPGDDAPFSAALAEDVERHQAEVLVRRVLAALDPKDAELIKLRHLVGAEASRTEVARMAGLTVGEFKWRYARAWDRFVDAVALDAPTERCRRTRRLLGALKDGPAAIDVAAEIDAHTLDCASCRVFARESYRALELIPLVPVVGVTERCVSRVAGWWDRSGPETSAGAGTAAAGLGIWSLLGGGSAAGLLKVAVIVCSTTAITAGVCAGVIAVVDDFRRPRDAAVAEAKKRLDKRAHDADPLAQPRRPRPIVTATPTPAPRKPEPTPRRSDSDSVDTRGEAQIPASAAPGALEFGPGASSAANEPAPATGAGGGEFTP